MSITPKAIQDLLDELEASRQARRRAWNVLQDLRLRAALTNLGNVTIEVPSRQSFEAEGAILKQALSDCLRDQRVALALLADAARQVDKAAFGLTADFGPAHQALLKALDRAEVLHVDRKLRTRPPVLTKTSDSGAGHLKFLNLTNRNILLPESRFPIITFRSADSACGDLSEAASCSSGKCQYSARHRALRRLPTRQWIDRDWHRLRRRRPERLSSCCGRS